MKNNITKTQCPHCAKQNEVKLWDVVSRETNPRVANRIINGTFFDHKCKYCGATYIVNYPVFYEDSFSDSIICYETSVIGESKALEAIKQRRQHMKDISKDYKIRIVTSPNAFREKARLFSCGLDDRIVEVMKILMLEHNQFGQTIKNLEETLCWADIERNSLNFEFFGDKQHVLVESIDFYNYVQNICSTRLEEQDPNPIYVDNNWAIDFLIRNNFTAQ